MAYVDIKLGLAYILTIGEGAAHHGMFAAISLQPSLCVEASFYGAPNQDRI